MTHDPAKCHCISYNQPQDWQTVPMVSIRMPHKFNNQGIALDACIADAVTHLWESDVYTLNSCCGHRDPNKRSIIVRHDEARKAKQLMMEFDPSVKILSWKLTEEILE